MARLLRSLGSSQAASGTDFYPELPQHVTDNLLLVDVTNDTGGTTLATTSTGWNTITGQADSGGTRQALFWKIATSAAEVSPLITGRNDDFTAIVSVWDEVDTSAPINISGRAGYTGTTTAASPTPTTTADECALYYSWSSDAAPYLTVPIGDLSFIDSKAQSTAITCVAGWRNQYTQGAAPTVTMTRNSSTNGGNAWVVGIKNKTNGGLRGECPDVCAVDRLYGTWVPGTYTAADTVMTDIDGLTTFSTATAISDLSAVFSQVSSSEIITGWVGGFDTLAANRNLAGKILSVYWLAPATLTGRVGEKGFIFSLVDASGNWKSFTLGKNKYAQMAVNNGYVSFIDVDGGEVLDSANVSGTFNSADIDKYGFHYHRAAAAANIATFSFNPIFDQTGIVFVGGNNDTPATPADIEFSCAEGPSLASAGFYSTYRFLEQNGSQQVILPVSLQIGDGGTTPTIIKFSGASIETPLPYSDNHLWNVADNKLSVVIYAGASDSIDLSSTILRANSPQIFQIHASSTASDIYDFNGLLLDGWTVTDNKGLPWIGTTFTNGGTVTIAGGGDLTNCTIAKTTSTHAPLTITANGTVVTTSTITVADTSITTAHHISFGASVTSCTLNGVTLSGAAGTDKIYSALASGTLTITVDGTGTALVAGDVTFVGGSTAVAVIAAPQVYQKVTVSGITTGARVQIYDTTSATELFNGTASAGDTVVTGSTVVWTDPTAAAADRAIRIRVSYVSGATAKNFIETSGLTCGQTAGTAEITYPVSPTDDTVYNANAITGSGVTGVTFTDAATDVVNINVVANAISWKTIYAAWVYYVFGATGIASDIDYIDAVDEANYILSNMIIKNTSSPTAPLEVTGGYGRDSVTGATIDLADTTGGTLIFAPDHVVSYAVGSGVTAQDITDIAAASGTAAATATLAAAQTTPIHSDVRKVVGITVDGTGTDIDPWGPQ